MSYPIINPIEEIAAYETLWEAQKATFKSIAEIFHKHPGSKPSDLIDKRQYAKNLDRVSATIKKLREELHYRPNLILNGSLNYPNKLRDAKEPVELLYYTGNLDLIYGRSVAIVGTRKPSGSGVKRTEKITKLLIDSGFTIASGLATGIDTIAHKTALKNGGKTIAVIGTPLSSVYPKENAYLQNFIARNHLLVSQVPFLRYESQDYRINRLFFY